MAKCPKCNANVDPSDKRCSKCGELLDKKSTSPKLIIGIIAVIVVLAIVGAFATGMFNGHASGSTASHDSSVNDNSPKETVKPVSDNNSSASANTEYWASAKAEKFHTPDCEWAQKISESNKIVYHSRSDAIADGKVPCTACNP
ncbi:zinc-ribbon domain-containing protein [uncultured Methanobrevibacter sp.]|uniref:zinc-ribbon domain-containing protein n=1 Tax=uncultured Methanobrevibacter sp. TaxID=253161 RepID=UPI0025E1450D|nr:zinc-ribbon domain-containing protein [uncultured Methanobrevibacter sp.]